MEQATRTAHRLALELEALRAEGVTTHAGPARELTSRAVATPRGGSNWTHPTVARVLERLGRSCRSPMLACPNSTESEIAALEIGHKEADIERQTSSDLPCSRP
jgi:hypothetical protein